jgi:S1-C subfamily serine protease
MELAHLSQQLAGVVDGIAPSVVRIEARRAASGVVWSNGVVLAADHALERDHDVRVGLGDGSILDAAIAGRDPALDLVVLRIPPDRAAPARWSELDGVRVGNLVLGIARPGRAPRATLGVVAALGDAWRTWAGGRVEHFLQTDLRPQPGFSGSVVADVEGRVIGLHTGRLRRGGPVALPVATLRRVVSQILAHGDTRRVFLGVGAIPVRLPSTLAAHAPAGRGLLVVSVQAGSPAEAGGVVLGDVVVALGSRPVGTLFDLLDALEEAGAGGPPRSLRVLRGGEARDVAVTLGERAA